MQPRLRLRRHRTARRPHSDTRDRATGRRGLPLSRALGQNGNEATRSERGPIPVAEYPNALMTTDQRRRFLGVWMRFGNYSDCQTSFTGASAVCSTQSGCSGIRPQCRRRPGCGDRTRQVSMARSECPITLTRRSAPKGFRDREPSGRIAPGRQVIWPTSPRSGTAPLVPKDPLLGARPVGRRELGANGVGDRKQSGLGVLWIRDPE